MPHWNNSQTSGSVTLDDRDNRLIAFYRVDGDATIDRLVATLNRLKQDLAWALPEVSGSVNAVLFWRWLAGDSRSARYELLSIATCGLGITQNMSAMAKLLVDLWRQKRVVEAEILDLLNHSQFDRDRQVMKQYYLPSIAQAICKTAVL